VKEYFSHDADASSDEKCVKLIIRHGNEGYGVFWRVIERLRQSSDYTLGAEYNELAYTLRCNAVLVKSVVEDFGLFSFAKDANGKRFYSESLMRRMQRMDEISARRKQAAHSRWDVKNANAPENVCKCNANAYKFDANAMQMHTNSDANKRKGNERKESPPTSTDGGECVSVPETMNPYPSLIPVVVNSLTPMACKEFEKYVVSKAMNGKVVNPIQQENITSVLVTFEPAEQVRILKYNIDGDWRTFCIPDDVKNSRLARAKKQHNAEKEKKLRDAMLNQKEEAQP